MDDPLSAVDAHVGKALFTDAILGALRARGKTVILVTHALHFLSQCDYIYTMANGHIVEAGSYTELIARGGDFARLSKEFGGENERELEKEEEEEAVSQEEEKKVEGLDKDKLRAKLLSKAEGKGTLEGRLMVKEARNTGSVPWYSEFLLPCFLCDHDYSSVYQSTQHT